MLNEFLRTINEKVALSELDHLKVLEIEAEGDEHVAQG